MTKRPGEKAPAPIGGAASERLRMFEEARGVRQRVPDDEQQTSASSAQQKDTKTRGGRRNEDRKRPGD
jgi:hypothetical protein